MMKFLSHYSAAYALRIPYLDTVLGVGSGRYNPQTAPTDITVSEKAASHMRAGYRVHLCTTELPRGAVARRDNQFVASPELVFLELAQELDLQRLILLGMQMCAHSPGRPQGAVTSKSRLQAFLESTAKHHGYKSARRALQYVQDGSNSVMESLVYMMLTLPHALGGFALAGASFNHNIPLADAAYARLRKKRYFVDLYYATARLIVEYDSFMHHHTAESQSVDHIRESALERQGIQTLRLTPGQLYDPERFEEFALNLAARIHKRIRNRAPGFDKAHASLRALLPTTDGDNDDDNFRSRRASKFAY